MPVAKLFGLIAAVSVRHSASADDDIDSFSFLKTESFHFSYIWEDLKSDWLEKRESECVVAASFRIPRAVEKECLPFCENGKCFATYCKRGAKSGGRHERVPRTNIKARSSLQCVHFEAYYKQTNKAHRSRKGRPRKSRRDWKGKASECWKRACKTLFMHANMLEKIWAEAWNGMGQSSMPRQWHWMYTECMLLTITDRSHSWPYIVHLTAPLFSLRFSRFSFYEYIKLACTVDGISENVVIYCNIRDGAGSSLR